MEQYPPIPPTPESTQTTLHEGTPPKPKMTLRAKIKAWLRAKGKQRTGVTKHE